MKQKPLIGILCNATLHLTIPAQSVTEYYLNAVSQHMDVDTLLIPADASVAVLARLDGLLLTGSRTNLHPRHYGVDATPTHRPFDEMRDATALSLIGEALARDIPLLAICRGFQELNVACGGSLHPAIHEISGRADHREPDVITHDNERFVVQHIVEFSDGGFFHSLLGVRSADVNSLHRQGVDRLGDNLLVEATAPDGTIEATRHKGARFCVGVQWHPEFQPKPNIISAPLFGAFQAAVSA